MCDLRFVCKVFINYRLINALFLKKQLFSALVLLFILFPITHIKLLIFFAKDNIAKSYS